MRHILYKYLTGASMIALTFSLNISTANATCSAMPSCESMGYIETSCPSGVESLKCPFDTTKLRCIQDCRDFTLNSCDSSKGTCAQCGNKWKYTRCNGNTSVLTGQGQCRCIYNMADVSWAWVSDCPPHAICNFCAAEDKYIVDRCIEGYTLSSWGYCEKNGYQVGDLVYGNVVDEPLGVVFYKDDTVTKVVSLHDINPYGETGGANGHIYELNFPLGINRAEWDSTTGSGWDWEDVYAQINGMRSLGYIFSLYDDINDPEGLLVSTDYPQQPCWEREEYWVDAWECTTAHIPNDGEWQLINNVWKNHGTLYQALANNGGNQFNGQYFTSSTYKYTYNSVPEIGISFVGFSGNNMPYGDYLPQWDETETYQLFSGKLRVVWDIAEDYGW